MSKKKKKKKPLDITESQARKLSKKICEHFKISPCNIWFLSMRDSNIKFPEAIGWYSCKKTNMPAYAMVEKYWSRRLILTLHELTHHLAEESYSTAFDSMHGTPFQYAKKRMATWCRNNLTTQWNWNYMIRRECDGRLCKPKKKKKGK